METFESGNDFSLLNKQLAASFSTFQTTALDRINKKLPAYITETCLKEISQCLRLIGAIDIRDMEKFKKLPMQLSWLVRPIARMNFNKEMSASDSRESLEQFSAELHVLRNNFADLTRFFADLKGEENVQLEAQHVAAMASEIEKMLVQKQKELQTKIAAQN